MFYQLCELFAGIMEMSIIVTAQLTRRCHCTW